MKSQDTQRGFAFALSAYLIWGVVPVYFKLLSHVPPIAIVAQRILWSIPLLLIIMAFRKQLGEYTAIFRHKAHLKLQRSIAARLQDAFKLLIPICKKEQMRLLM